MGNSSLTVFFQEPFWVGVFEREAEGRYEACRVVFGAEPKDYTVYAFVLAHYDSLRFSPFLETAPPVQRRISPKRRQRAARDQLQGGIGTKAQQALKLQQEEGKQARKLLSRAEREAEQERQFALRQEKRREKRNGH